MALNQDTPEIDWQYTARRWVLACLGGYAGAAAGTGLGAYAFLYLLPGSGWFGYFGNLGIWGHTLSFGLFYLSQLFLGAVLASIFQSLIFRLHLPSAFRWLKFTTLGAVVGLAVWAVPTIFLPVMAMDTICGNGCFEQSGGAIFLAIIFLYISISSVIPCLIIAMVQGWALRPLGMSFRRWCLFSGGTQVLAVMLILVVQLVVAPVPLNWPLADLFYSLLSWALVGLGVGIATAKLIVPMLRSVVGENSGGALILADE